MGYCRLAVLTGLNSIYTVIFENKEFSEVFSTGVDAFPPY
jgi:hypothetical protein